MVANRAMKMAALMPATALRMRLARRLIAARRLRASAFASTGGGTEVSMGMLSSMAGARRSPVGASWEAAEPGGLREDMLTGPRVREDDRD